ncbi:hypothetical protein [Clostridioides sp. ES-S-0001-03]|uniref:hypothetical protein n=1 Tax=Clostridioides sp. ES-S-0001-03 TaxID=2770771 RepID=UPI001D0CC3FA
MQKREMIELLQNVEDESKIDSLLENLDLFKSKESKNPTIDEFKSLILSLLWIKKTVNIIVKS